MTSLKRWGGMPKVARGQAMVEYALIVVVIAIAVVVVMVAMGSKIADVFNTMTQKLGN